MARAGFAERRRKSIPEHLNSPDTWVLGLYGESGPGIDTGRAKVVVAPGYSL